MSTRRRLSQLLLASHVGLVLLFVALLLATGLGTIRSAVVAQARSEAERTVSESKRRLLDWKRELEVGADLLAEQPTLRFYLQTRQSTKARALVNAFHATSDIGYVRVQLSDRIIAEVGEAPPTLESGLAFDLSGAAWRVASRPIESFPQATIVLAERLDNRLSESPGNDLVTVRLQPSKAPGAKPVDAWQRALLQVSNTGEPDTFEDIRGDATARIEVLRDDQGTARSLLSARVADEWVRRRIIESFAAFGLSSLATIILALAIAIFVARRIGRPFAELAQAAERLGGGDLQTPVLLPDSFLAEPVALAASLEQMRGRVGTLTARERSQREELDAILDGVDEGIVGIDPEQSVHYANRQFLALVGRERSDVLGERIDALLVSRDGEASILPELGGSLARAAAVGSMRPLVVRRQGASGEQQVLVVREETAVEAARAMRDRIMANLSHEFQTPLSAQMASIELLRDHLAGSDDKIAVQLADAQFRGTMRLSQLVDNLLDSVRFESGEMRLRRDPVALPAVVAEAIELVKPLTDQRFQVVVADLGDGPPIIADAQRLFSVMVNLLANANKFAPDRTTIRVDIEWAASTVTVWVEDEGPGLPTIGPTDDLFAPFRRAPNEEPSQRGTGLGLAIVKAVVVAHGGQVLVSPSPQRQGTRIGVQLPIGGER